MKINYFFSGIGLILLLSSCSYKFDKNNTAQQGAQSKTSEVQKSDLSFAKVSAQVLGPKCLKCHNQYSNYAAVLESKSAIYERALVQQDMPKAGSGLVLTLTESALLKEWLDAGAPFDNSSANSSASAGTEVISSGTTSVNSLPFERPVVWDTVKIKILDKHCVSCHFAGNTDGISPYVDYETVKNTIGTIYAFTAINPFMPPPSAELAEGESNPNQLTREEKDLISAWINDGLLEKK